MMGHMPHLSCDNCLSKASLDYVENGIPFGLSLIWEYHPGVRFSPSLGWSKMKDLTAWQLCNLSRDSGSDL